MFEMDRRIAFLKIQIVSNLQREWTIEEMAQEVEISVSQLQKLFKNETGMPPIQYLRHLRLEKARNLLVSSFKQVKVIAALVGQPDQSHFTRDFKDKYGYTPSEYRNRFCEKTRLEDEI